MGDVSDGDSHITGVLELKLQEWSHVQARVIKVFFNG